MIQVYTIFILEGKNKEWRKVLNMGMVIVIGKKNNWTWLTDQRHKSMFYFVTGDEQLLDLVQDPDEKMISSAFGNIKISLLGG